MNLPLTAGVTLLVLLTGGAILSPGNPAALPMLGAVLGAVLAAEFSVQRLPELTLGRLYAWMVGGALLFSVLNALRGEPDNLAFAVGASVGKAVVLSLLFLGVLALIRRGLTWSRVCPFCAERVRRAAIVCRYCGRSFDGSDARQ